LDVAPALTRMAGHSLRSTPPAYNIVSQALLEK
jgi:hypothetical protein